MQRRWQPFHRRKIAALPIATEEMQLALTDKFVLNTRPPTKVQKIRAAAHRHMLAMVNRVASRLIGERAGPSAQLSSRFKEFDVQSATHQCRGARHAGQTSTDDRDSWHRHHERMRNARPTMPSFCSG